MLIGTSLLAREFVLRQWVEGGPSINAIQKETGFRGYYLAVGDQGKVYKLSAYYGDVLEVKTLLNGEYNFTGISRGHIGSDPYTK